MAEFQTLVLKAKDDVYTHLQGSNFSKILGQGYDFFELRTYESTDDIRYVSWINSAKLAEPYVKIMHEERELLVYVALLVDGRAVIGEKKALMTEILALLSYSTLHANNLLETSFLLGSELKSFEATKDTEAVENLLQTFNAIEPLGLELDYENIEKKLLKLQAQKGLFFLVGDFLDEVDLSILAQKHELCVVMVRDSWEENPVLSSDTELVNPLSNTGITQSMSKKALMHYRKKVEEHDEKLYAHFHVHKIKYVKVYKSDNVFQKLEALFYF